jgi:hypothetical protein
MVRPSKAMRPREIVLFLWSAKHYLIYIRDTFYEDLKAADLELRPQFLLSFETINSNIAPKDEGEGVWTHKCYYLL